MASKFTLHTVHVLWWAPRWLNLWPPRVCTCIYNILSHNLRTDLWTPVKGLGQSRMMKLTRKYLISSSKTLTLMTSCQPWQGLQLGWVLHGDDQTSFYTGLPLHTCRVCFAPKILLKISTKQASWLWVESKWAVLACTVKLKQAVQNQDLADRFCIHIT